MPGADVKRVVLVGEDDRSIANLLRDALNDEPDVNAVVVTDGELVVEALRQVKADLLILDMMMPGLGGLDVYDRIQRAPELGWPSILFMTAAPHRFEDFELRRTAEVIAKPFDLNELLARTRALLDQRSRAG